MKSFKRILAILGVIFFVGLYVITFVVAFLDIPYQEAILQTCIFSTFFITLFIAAFAGIFRFLKKLNGSDSETE